ncbi:MAG: hypothetical protein AAGI25_07680 [Bacteroidota bacterium]
MKGVKGLFDHFTTLLETYELIAHEGKMTDALLWKCPVSTIAK